MQNFEFVVYVLTADINSIFNLENQYINYFPSNMLYNVAPTAGSMLGYKHRKETILKMKAGIKNKTNNSMFGKTKAIKTLNLISAIKSSPITLYNNDNEYILTFKNNNQLAKFIGCSNSTVSRYIKSGKCYKDLYYFKTN
jgi:hypothetical protein